MKPPKKKREPSRLERAAEDMLIEAGYAIRKQYQFHRTRKWRADFLVWVPMTTHRCLVEIEGLTTFGNHLGWHQRKEGFEANCEKYNAAALMGWTVLRFTETMLVDGTMIRTLKEYFDAKAG